MSHLYQLGPRIEVKFTKPPFIYQYELHYERQWVAVQYSITMIHTLRLTLYQS